MKIIINYLYVLLIFIACQYSFSNTTIQYDNCIYKFDTIKVVALKNKIYNNVYVRIIDLKDIDKYIRRIVLQVNKKEYLLCNLDQNDFSGFSIDKIKENQKGFEIFIEYGSRIYWNRIFYFVYSDRCFYLIKIRSIHFDKYKNNNPVINEKKYRIPLGKDFNILSYLNF